MSNCERCGLELQIGMFPFCHGDPMDHGKWYGAEEPIAPYFDEHISAEGAEIRTRGERRRLMRQNGLEYKDLSKAKRGRVYAFLGGK